MSPYLAKGICRCDYVKALRELIPDYLGGSSIITRVLKSGRGIGRENQRGGSVRTQTLQLTLKMEEEDCELRNAGSF